MAKQDFLSLLDLSIEDLDYLIQRGKQFRKMHEAGEVHQPLVGKTGALNTIGIDNVFSSKAEAIASIYHRLDRSVCEECEYRIFSECGEREG